MPAPEKALRIEIPVELSEAKLVLSIGALQFEGDLPVSLFHMQLIKNDIVDWDATSEIVAVFHTNAGHVTLHDSAYNASRNVAIGNPTRISFPLPEARRGGEALRRDREGSRLGNEDFRKDIKFNTDAMARTTQLVQHGFVKITE